MIYACCIILLFSRSSKLTPNHLCIAKSLRTPTLPQQPMLNAPSPTNIKSDDRLLIGANYRQVPIIAQSSPALQVKQPFRVLKLQLTPESQHRQQSAPTTPTVAIPVTTATNRNQLVAPTTPKPIIHEVSIWISLHLRLIII